MSKLFDLTGKTAFVTGAASGLGYAMAEGFAEHGALVTLADANRAGLDAAVAKLNAAGHQAMAVELDVREPAAIRSAVAGAAKHYGKMDIVVANAGITGGAPISEEAGHIENIDLETWNNVVKINQTGVFATLQAAAAVMKPQKSGRIIVTASISGLRTSEVSGYPYTVTKAAVIHMVHLAAIELAPYNILVNGVAPGPFMTNIAGGRLFREPERVKAMANSVPLKRMADPQEIKGLALLLASGAGSFITGQVIPIDGGSTAL
ncbi:SDR family NAD(P)-dependent oxidoreductase [Roseiarcaceae bacterium H3SJ34-1]|uniref:SDR family NAD(P)-dependent oxidoreductase n=1 Tax=Terripilifer ovatus TaxID=3032367 RepID=UPI003AB95DE6|nr:SDR family NAD(P)-dependent oxidoreductase [Roseiarcaceae bacterium H3SJ34-1]